MNKYYAGIGSRETPEHIQILMTAIAKKLNSMGYILRSGGALGADQAFEFGATSKQIFYANDVPLASEAFEYVDRYHPYAHSLKPYTRKLMARNTFQILGYNLKDPVNFVLCWTRDGAETETSSKTGGTGQAIRIAIAHDIKVFNLKNEDTLERWEKWLKA